MDVEALARRLARKPAPPTELRDALVLWFVNRAEPQVRRGMCFTDPAAGIPEVRHVARLRARSFFLGLASTFDDPTAADLRRVLRRMAAWLKPDSRRRDQEDLWEEILGGSTCSMSFSRT